VRVDEQHREMGGRSLVRRPLVVLHSSDPCPIPLRRQLWWSDQPDGREFVLEAITPASQVGVMVTLKLMTGSGRTALPAVGSEACFSIHTTGDRWPTLMPSDVPWTHQPEAGPAPVETIEDLGQDSN
jgi:hypothetical protein